MKTSLHHLLSRRRREGLVEAPVARKMFSREKHAEQPQPHKSGETPLVGSGDPVGYWMLPNGSGGYVKLRIHGQYTFREDLMLPNVKEMLSGLKNLSLKSLWGGLMGDSSHTVDIVINGNLAPVWPVVCVVPALAKHFPWLSRLVNGDNAAVFLPSTEERCYSAALRIQEGLISHGWAFCVRPTPTSDTVYYCGDPRSKTFGMWVAEVTGRLEMNPHGIGITSGPDDIRTIARIQLFNPSGGKEEVLPFTKVVSELAGSAGPDEPEDDSFADGINRLGIKEASIVDFLNVGKSKVRWREYKDWRNIEPEIVEHFFNAVSFARMFKKASDQETKDKLKLARKAALEYADDHNLDLGADDLEDLTEATFRELLRATQRNGDYKVGGMRRIGRLWVYDPSVPDRVANSRFVFTKKAKLSIGPDGYPWYRVWFRSAPDRNTTGMAHPGYIKFIGEQKDRSFIGRVRDYFKDEIDLQVHCWCGCEDFRYRWAYALAKAGASHTPTGAGFDATNQPPRITNPSMAISLCKHLVACKDMLLLDAGEHYAIVRKLRGGRQTTAGEIDKPETEMVKPGAEIESDEAEEGEQ